MKKLLALVLVLPLLCAALPVLSESASSADALLQSIHDTVQETNSDLYGYFFQGFVSEDDCAHIAAGVCSTKDLIFDYLDSLEQSGAITPERCAVYRAYFSLRVDEALSLIFHSFEDEKLYTSETVDVSLAILDLDLDFPDLNKLYDKIVSKYSQLLITEADADNAASFDLSSLSLAELVELLQAVKDEIQIRAK